VFPFYLFARNLISAISFSGTGRVFVRLVRRRVRRQRNCKTCLVHANVPENNVIFALLTRPDIVGRSYRRRYRRNRSNLLNLWRTYAYSTNGTERRGDFAFSLRKMFFTRPVTCKSHTHKYTAGNRCCVGRTYYITAAVAFGRTRYVPRIVVQ